MSVQSEINRINEAKADIQSALADMGVDAGGHGISALADDVRSISVVKDVKIGSDSIVTSGVANIPTQMPPTAHNHPASDLSDLTMPSQSIILVQGVHYVDSEADLPTAVAGQLIFVKRA